MNVDVLDEAVTFIEDHPEKHNQAVWTCSTGACLAGHITLLNGYQVATEDCGEFMGGEYVLNGVVLDPRTNLRREVSATAQNLLDATSDETNLLFAAGNTAEDLRLMAKDVANDEDITKLWKLIDVDTEIPKAVRA